LGFLLDFIKFLFIGILLFLGCFLGSLDVIGCDFLLLSDREIGLHSLLSYYIGTRGS